MKDYQAIEDLFKRIDGPLFKEQRLAILNLIEDSQLCDYTKEMLEGVQSLLDEIADIAYDSFGIDCLYLESPHES